MNSKSNESYLTIFYFSLIPICIILIFTILYSWITDYKNYATPVYIPLASFAIAIFYFCITGFSKIDKSHAKPNVKSNYRGLFKFGCAFIIVCIAGYGIIIQKIWSPLSDILTIISIILTIAVNFLTDLIVKIAEKK